MKIETLYDLLKQDKNNEWTVWDKDYDTEFYMTYDNHKDADHKWEQGMMEIAKALKVVEIHKDGVVCDVSDLLERKLPTLKELGMIYEDVDVDDLMSEWDMYMSGYTSERFMYEFGIALNC